MRPMNREQYRTFAAALAYIHITGRTPAMLSLSTPAGGNARIYAERISHTNGRMWDVDERFLPVATSHPLFLRCEEFKARGFYVDTMDLHNRCRVPRTLKRGFYMRHADHEARIKIEGDGSVYQVQNEAGKFDWKKLYGPGKVPPAPADLTLKPNDDDLDDCPHCDAIHGACDCEVGPELP